MDALELEVGRQMDIAFNLQEYINGTLRSGSTTAENSLQFSGFIGLQSFTLDPLSSLQVSASLTGASISTSAPAVELTQVGFLFLTKLACSSPAEYLDFSNKQCRPFRSSCSPYKATLSMAGSEPLHAEVQNSYKILAYS